MASFSIACNLSAGQSMENLEMRFDMRIGIVDSGINCGAVKSVVHQWDFTNQNGTVSSADQNGHGTMSAKVLEEFSDTAIEFISAKIFGDRLAADIKTLIRALDFLETCDLDLLHMSISIDEDILNRDIKRICRNMLDHGTRIVTAFSNKMHKTAMAQMKGVITVQGQNFENSACYWFSDRTGKAIADKVPLLVSYDRNRYRFYNGNSKAASILTSHLINCFNHEKKEFQMDFFKRGALKNDWVETDERLLDCRLQPKIDTWKDIAYDLRRMIEVILMEILQVHDQILLKEHSWIGYPFGINGMKAFEIIHRIENECKIKFDMKNIFLSYFLDYQSFGYLLKSNLALRDRLV